VGEFSWLLPSARSSGEAKIQSISPPVVGSLGKSMRMARGSKPVYLAMEDIGHALLAGISFQATI
jgi:hypothetical protein